MKNPRLNGVQIVLALMIALLITSGCQTTRRARNVKTSGFLGDYSQLYSGSGDEALLTYVNPNADFRRYNKIILEPIKVYPGVGDSFFRQLSPEDMQKLVNYFDATLRDKLGENYTFVNEPGPDVMRIRIALTEIDPSNVPVDLVSSVLPIGMALSALKSVTFGRGSGVGSASAEFDALDSQTGERLGASVDRRVGKKYTERFDKLNRWHATQATFDYWAERLKERLVELRNGPKTE